LAWSGVTFPGVRDLVVGSILQELHNRLLRLVSNWQRVTPDNVINQLFGLERAFGVERPVALPRLSADEIAAEARYYEQQRASNRGFDFWLTELWGLVTMAGFGGIYLLVDRIDDVLPSNYPPHQAMDVLQQLRRFGLLAPGNNMAVKFFLNAQLENLVREQLRINGVPFYRIGKWSAQNLLRLFNYRLTSFASQGNVRAERHLLDFCASDVREQNLLDLAEQCAQGSPAVFIDLIRMICAAHCEAKPVPHARIARETIQRVIELNCITSP
jgi:hypothetical protein